MQASQSILESLSALADETRCRLLALLDGRELTVSELCAVLQLPQSTVSRQLKILSDSDWVESRRDGTSRYYTRAAGRGDDPRAQIWDVTRREMAGRPQAAQDERRLAHVLARRNEASRRFFATSAGQWDDVREELFGDFSSAALLGLLPSHWVVGDLGCGTGSLVRALASQVQKVIGVDASDEMLAAARTRVGARPNVDLRKGDLETLPIEDQALDAAVMMLVLHHLPIPGPALRDAHRVLKPGGQLLIVDMAPHAHEEYRRQMGHVWLGFTDDHLRQLLGQAGFETARIDHLPPTPEAKGPSLVAAVGRTPDPSHSATK